MNISMAEQAKSDKHQVRLDMMLSFGNVFLFSLVCLVFFIFDRWNGQCFAQCDPDTFIYSYSDRHLYKDTDWNL